MDINIKEIEEQVEKHRNLAISYKRKNQDDEAKKQLIIMKNL